MKEHFQFNVPQIINYLEFSFGMNCVLHSLVTQLPLHIVEKKRYVLPFRLLSNEFVRNRPPFGKRQCVQRTRPACGVKNFLL